MGSLMGMKQRKGCSAGNETMCVLMKLVVTFLVISVWESSGKASLARGRAFMLKKLKGVLFGLGICISRAFSAAVGSCPHAASDQLLLHPMQTPTIMENNLPNKIAIGVLVPSTWQQPQMIIISQCLELPTGEMLQISTNFQACQGVSVLWFTCVCSAGG